MFVTTVIDEDFVVKFRETIKRASQIKVKKKILFEGAAVQPKFTADAIIGQVKPKNLIQTPDKVIVPGAFA